MHYVLTVKSVGQRLTAAYRGPTLVGFAVSLIAAACVIIPSQAAASTGTSWGKKSVGGCTVAAGITYDTGQDRFYIAGYIVCGKAGTRSMNCNPVHRHSVYWHSHPTAIRYSSPTNFNQTSGWIGGTNGDTYKSHCNFSFAGANLGAVESPAITL